MIIGVDIGGTKTLIAVFAENGKILNEVRFSTNQKYEEFLEDLTVQAKKLETSKAKIACAAVPGLLDRKNGVVKSLGNLPWKNLNIRNDIAQALGVKKVLIENDSKLAGLSEARYFKDQYSRLFYLTLSTGIGGALLVDGQLDQDVIDMEIGKIPLFYKSKISHWEEFASGRAFANTYDKKATEVTDQKIWEEYSQTVNAGLGIICSIFQVEAIVFGGGLGQHVDRFRKNIMPYLEKNLHPIVARPKALLASHYKGQSVIYGCYAHAKDNLS